VVGVPHDTKGTVPIAFVTHAADTVGPDGQIGAVPADNRRRVVAELGGYAQLDQVYVTGAMPKTRTGKTMRRLLRDLVEHGAPTGDVSAMEDAGALEAVAAAVRDSRDRR